MDVTIWLSIPCSSCVSFSFNWGWELRANVTLHCPGRCTAQGYVSPVEAGRWGAQGAWSGRAVMAQCSTGVLKHTLGCTPAGRLFSGHRMRCSSVPSHTQCVRHIQLSCVSSVWIYVTFEPWLHYLHKVRHWYALTLQKGVLNILEFKHKPPSGLVFTQKLFPLITLHR